MNKNICFVLVFAMIAAILPKLTYSSDNVSGTYQEALFYDDFENYAVGTVVPTDTYYYNSSLLPNPTVYDYGGAYGNVLKITGNASTSNDSWCGPQYSVVTNQYDEDNPLTKCTLEFDINLNGKFNASVSALDLIHSTEGGGGFMALVGFSSNGTITFGGSSKTINYTPGNWYSFKIELDYNNYEQTIYVNGNLILDRVSMQKKTHTAFKHFRVSISSNSSSNNLVFLDNIKYIVPYTGAEPSITLSNNGDGSYRASCVVGKDYAQKPIMALVTYQDGVLKDVAFDQGILYDDVTYFSATYKPKLEHKLQVFVLESLQSMKPLCKSENVYVYSKRDFMEVKDNWRKYLVGDEHNDIGNEHVDTRIKVIDSNAQNAQATMNRADHPAALWGNEITTTAHMTAQYSKIYSMALAWGTYGSILYHNEQLKQDIIYALEWGYENLYGESEINGTGWRKTSLFNWWDWFVGVPRYLVDTLLIMESEFSQEDIHRYLSLFKHLLSVMRTEPIREHISSRSYNVLAAAMLWEDPDLAVEMIMNYRVIFSFVTTGTGMYEDFSYLTHNYIPYTGSYGTSALLDRIVSVMAVTNGTKFEFSGSYIHIFEQWILQAFQPLMYNGGMMSMVNGRSVASSSEHTRGFIVIRSVLDMMDAVSKETAYEFKMLVKRHLVPDIESYVYRNLSVNQITKLDAILADQSLPEPEDYILNRVYYNMDRVVHHRKDFAVGISMSSSRIANYESINGANATGWYHSDGMLYLYNKHDVAQYNVNYFKYADPYKMPGTTVDTQVRQAVNISGGKEYFSNQDFVGGVSLNNEYGVAAMQLESFHNDVVDHSEPKESGGPQPLHDCSLMAKKAWFLFDDEVVALGSDINAQDDVAVRTIVENRKLYSTTNAEKILVDGKAASKINGVEQVSVSPTWVYIEGTGGYYFPNHGNLHYQRSINSSTRFFEMWLDHGVNPNNETYAYVLLPNKTVEEIIEYSQSPDIAILANTPSLQAVHESSLSITGMVFWESGSYGELTVSQPLLVMVREKDDIYEIALSDPTHKLTEVQLTINNNLTLLSSDKNMTIDCSNLTASIHVDFSHARGETFFAKFQKSF